MIKLTSSFILSVALLTMTSQSLAAPVCHEVFAHNAESSDATEKSIESLAAYRIKLDEGRAAGNTSIATSAMEADYFAKENALFQHLTKNNLMTAAELKVKISTAIAKIQTAKPVKTEAEKDQEKKEKELQTRAIRSGAVDGNTAVFYHIEPGSFIMYQRDQHPSGITLWKPHPVTLTKPFEMMATPVTQIIWKKIADLSNSKPGRLQDHKLNPSPSSYIGSLHPVESVTARTIGFWIIRLNELSAAGDPELLGIIPDHKAGDRYRLPTEAEWEFVATQRGQNDGKEFFEDPATAYKYAWFDGNSGGTTHDVATKLPIEFDHMKFFDMAGNVAEVIADTPPAYGDLLRGGVDPYHNHPSNFIITKGGDFSSKLHLLLPHEYRTPEAHFTEYNIGFRLVREARDAGGTP